MATINLLPWRDVYRQEKQREFLSMLFLLVILTSVFCYIYVSLVKNEVGQQRARNVLLEKEIAVLDQHVNEIKKLKEHREELELKMSAIRGLRNERPLIVHYFDEMVKLVPDGVYFNSLNNKEMLFEISGVADSKNRVSELMRGLEKSPFFFSTNLKSVVKNGFKLTVNAAIPEEFYKLVEE